MKHGRTLTELAQELTRQREVKRDFLIDTRNLVMDAAPAGDFTLTMENPTQRQNTVLGINDIAHRQMGTTLGIPAKYYDKMRQEHPVLLAANVNGWFCSRLIRWSDPDGTPFPVRPLRDRHSRSPSVTPIIFGIEALTSESAVTDRRMIEGGQPRSRPSRSGRHGPADPHHQLRVGRDITFSR